MNSYNAIGNITAKPLFFEEKNHKPAYLRFTLAINYKKTVDYVPCIVFGKYAETLNAYMKKGMKVSVTGMLKTHHKKTNDRWENLFDIQVEKVGFLSSTNEKKEKDKKNE